MALGVDTTLWEVSSSTVSSESEDVGSINNKSTPRNSLATRKSFSHTSLADFRSLPLLKDRLGAILDKKIHCDVTFHVGPTKDIIQAHRIILTTASHIFERLFYESTVKSCQSDTITFHESDYSTTAFQYFIKAIYTNEFPQDLSLPLALEMFYASKKYQVAFLEEQILAHILQTICVENVFEALKVSTNSIELTKIVPICWKLIEENTSKVLASHLDHIDELNFTRILTRDHKHLNIEEVELFQFLVKWGSIQCKRRGLKTTGKSKRQLIDHLLKYIRFSTINSMDFNDIIIPSRIFEPKEIFSLQSQSHTTSINHQHHHHYQNSGESPVCLPYDSRPRFKPQMILPRPDFTTNSELLSPVHHSPGDGDAQVEKNHKTKLRPKKCSRKLNISKQTNGSRAIR